MTIIEQQLLDLRVEFPDARATKVASGGHLIELPGYKLGDGWNAKAISIIFLAPPGYPAAQPDCFWIEPGGFRLASGAVPQNSSDGNPIPGVGPRGTWFSWHLQQWNPNRDSLMTYVNAIERRLHPAR